MSENDKNVIRYMYDKAFGNTVFAVLLKSYLRRDSRCDGEGVLSEIPDFGD
jgi:hypothetical protein